MARQYGVAIFRGLKRVVINTYTEWLVPDVRNGSVTVAPLLLSAISAALHGVSIAVSPGTTGSPLYKSCGQSRFESLENCVSDLASKKRAQLRRTCTY